MLRYYHGYGNNIMGILDSNQIPVRKGDYICLLFFLPLLLGGMFFLTGDHVDWLLSRPVDNFYLSRYFSIDLFVGPSFLFLDELIEVAMPNKLFDLIFQGIAVLGIVSIILVEMIIFAFIIGCRGDFIDGGCQRNFSSSISMRMFVPGVRRGV